MNLKQFSWVLPPKKWSIDDSSVEITTEPHTDLWQTTYYHFRNDNAPMLLMESEEPFFSFTVRTEFDLGHRFDQCGIVLYQNSENWLKASIEYENEKIARLGSVVTNLGYSDWAVTEIPAGSRFMWYRLSRRDDDFKIECSKDGISFEQMRIAHLFSGKGIVHFGIYACSPEASTFRAKFTNFELTECKWPAHDGQQPDERC